MFEHLLGWLLLPLGIALGWYFRRNLSSSRLSAGGMAPESIREGWGDAAPPADELLRMLLNPETESGGQGDLQLQLGTLFRKRGEVDRALALHQALAERQNLDPELSRRVRIELAADYERAGLFDHAEGLYRELASQGVAAVEALTALRGLYEQGHDWQQAWDTNQHLQAVAGRAEHRCGAHYACELAEQAASAGDAERALRWAQTACQTDPQSPRPWLLSARLHAAAGRHADAVTDGWRAVDADAGFIGEALPLLWSGHQALGTEDEFAEELQERCLEQPVAAALLKQAELVEAGGADPLPTLIDAFGRLPSWTLLERLSSHIQIPADAPLAPALDTLRGAMAVAARRRPRYRCSECGMQPGQLLWQCPSCRNWGTIAPVDDRIDA